jgi:predicted transcriptional regulator
MLNTLDEINRSEIPCIEKSLESYIFDLSKDESEIFRYFENIGIPLDKTKKLILSAEINRFKGKLVNSLMKHIVSKTAHKNTDAGKDVLYERFDFDF